VENPLRPDPFLAGHTTLRYSLASPFLSLAEECLPLVKEDQA